MKDKRLNILIIKSVKDVFEFTINPANTPKWIDDIVIEETNEFPPKLGTIYRNKNKLGNWNEYEITTYVKDKMFELKRKNGFYYVRYTFKPTKEGYCNFEYYEWVTKGQLDDTFSDKVLQKLKKIVENNE